MPIRSIVDMSSRISSMDPETLNPRQISDLFTLYYDDERYSTGRIPKIDFVQKIIPMMQQLIGDAPRTFRRFDPRAMMPGRQSNVVLTRKQVAVIVSCMWFGLFDYDYLEKDDLELFPEPTFVNIFTSQRMFALRCVLNYFQRVYDTMDTDLFTSGKIIIARNTLQSPPDWISSNLPMSELFIGDGPTVDDSPAKIHVACCHEYIGGDMFKNSLTQEEITILIRPECLAATLFCAGLHDNETITVMGAEKMSQYTGYGSSVSFVENFVDDSPVGYSKDKAESMFQTAIVFMDASSRTSGKSQFIDDFLRDLNKAYCGFNSMQFSAPGEQVASGHWAYGFNGNDIRVKFLQQWLAATLANKTLIYHPFGRDFEERLIVFTDWVQRNAFTVGQLFRAYLELIKSVYSGPSSRLNGLDIFECIMDM